jgi:hypothetical protein
MRCAVFFLFFSSFTGFDVLGLEEVYWVTVRVGEAATALEEVQKRHDNA